MRFQIPLASACLEAVKIPDRADDLFVVRWGLTPRNHVGYLILL